MDVTAGPASGTVRERVLAYATLVRLPNVFTAPPDVIAGGALVAAAGGTVSVWSIAALSVASASIYAGGTTLNDYFDADIDAVERPERPIPSGRISRRGALTFGVALLSVGVVVSAVSVGLMAGIVAATVAGLVVLYDGVAKDTALGFAVMGMTRGVNVVLGTTAGEGLSTLPTWVFIVPVAITVYIATLTWMAADEAHGGDPRVISFTAVVAAAAAVAAPVVTALATDGWLRVVVAAAVAGGFLAFVGGPLRTARADPTPETVGPAVGKGVVGLVILEAAFATIAGLRWSVAAVLFVLPAVALARLFDVS